MPLSPSMPESRRRAFCVFLAALFLVLVGFAAADETGSLPFDAVVNAAPAAPPQPGAAVDFDFDGDGKSDLSRWHPSSTEFKIKNSNGGSYQTYTTVGTSSDKLAPADYDGDGKTDVATFNAGTWKIRESNSGTITTITGFGQAGDIPMSGNYRNTGADELAYYRPSNGTWYWRELGNATVYSLGWGQSGDIPVAGDYEGDGLMDPAIFRPSTGYWYLVLSSNSSQVNMGWGQSGDVPLAGDFDGDGKTDLTVFRPSSGMWYSKKSGTGYTTWSTQAWGNYDDQPVAGDFDGDSKADYAIWRPSSGVWYVMKSLDSGILMEPLGVPGDTAVASSYIKGRQRGCSRPDREGPTCTQKRNRRHRSLLAELFLGPAACRPAGPFGFGPRIGDQLQLSGLDEGGHDDAVRSGLQQRQPGFPARLSHHRIALL